MKFITKKPPIVTNGENTYKRSLNLHIALLITALTTVILNGFYEYFTPDGEIPVFVDSVAQSFKVFSLVVLAAAISVIIELFYALSEGDTSKFNSYKGYVEPINVGILIALLLPITTPVFVLALTVFIGVYVGKLVFGGYGFYIFNPALVGAIFAFSAFGDVLSISEPTPLLLLKDAITEGITYNANALQLLIGNYASLSVGSTSAIALFLIFIYLIVTRVTDIRTSGTFLLTVIIMSFGIGFMLYDSSIMATSYMYINLFTGLTMFGAVFLVSETVSSPTSRETKIIYAATVGVLLMVFRTLSSNVEGLVFAVLFGNMITPFLNRTVKKSNKKALIKTLVGVSIMVVFATIVVGLMLKNNLDSITVTEQVQMIGGML